MEKKIAVVDVGSNSIRLVITKVYEDGSYRMVDQAKEMVRLSEGMGEDKNLKPQAIKRALDTLKLFTKLMEIRRVDMVIPVATAAVRQAGNRELFLEKVAQETGLQLMVISGEEEAYYDYLGVINTITVENALILDIGGGSTELVRVEKRKMKAVASLPYGAVNLTDYFLNKDGLSPSSLYVLARFITQQLDSIPWLKELAQEDLSLIGLGGTVRALAKMDKRKTGFPLESLHNYILNRAEVHYAYKQVTTVGWEERGHIPGVDKDRADIIPAGFTIVKTLMEYLGAPRLIVSGSGLREGAFFENYFRVIQAGSPVVEDVLTHSITNILKTYDAKLDHCYHVRKLALSLFDQTQELHGSGREGRHLLSVASLLHDIGMSVDYCNHHRHGFYLVLNSRLNGLSNRELVMCAFIVGLHGGEGDFKNDWKNYKMLINKEDIETVKKLGLYLRLAENLERYGFGNVEKLTCHLTPDTLEIKLQAQHSPDLEINTAMKNEKIFAKLFQRKLHFVKITHKE